MTEDADTRTGRRGMTRRQSLGLAVGAGAGYVASQLG